MEEQLVQLVHALTNKTKDVKWSYGNKIWQLSLELEHLHGIILYEWEHHEHQIDPLKFETHKQEHEKNNARPMFG
jgi:hypothetical protein